MTTGDVTPAEKVRLLRARVKKLRGRLDRRDEQIATLEQSLANAEQEVGELAARFWLPGRYYWPPTVERWRSLVHAYLQHYGGWLYWSAADRILDQMLGCMRFESTSQRCPNGGDPRAISRVEWVGEPPPGYDPDDDSTKASGLFQIPPPYWPARSKAAGFDGFSIFDADANAATACYMLFASWPEDRPAPHWHHWSGAHVGVRGSYEKAVEILDQVDYS